MKQRIRGIGLITWLGNTKEAFIKTLNKGKHRCLPITNPTYNELNGFYSNPITDFDGLMYYSEKELANADRNSVLAATAAKLALQDASSSGFHLLPDHTGVAIGTTLSIATSMSDFDESVLKEGSRHCKINVFPNTVMNAPASRVAIFHGITGPNTTISSGYNSGIDAIGHASLTISEGFANAMICGGTEALSEKLLLGFAKRGLLVQTPHLPENIAGQKSSRQVIPSEGSVLLIIAADESINESSPHYCAITGYGCSFSPFKARQVPYRAELIYRTTLAVIKEAGIDLSDIGLVLLGTGFDRFSLEAAQGSIKLLFGESVDQYPVLRPQKLLGDCFAALGPQLVLIAQGYFDEHLDEAVLIQLNENTEWAGRLSRGNSSLIIHADSEGHNSILLLMR